MYLVDFVRFGAMAAGWPGAGVLYAQLVEDFSTGMMRRGVEDYCALTGLSDKHVANSFDRLVEWGLAARVGKQRFRKVELLDWPNELFFEAVVRGVYGQEALDEVAKGNRAAELCPSEGPSVPAVNYAMQYLLGTYADRGLVRMVPTEPSDATGKGYVVMRDENRTRTAFFLKTYTVQCVTTANYSNTTAIRTSVFPDRLPEGMKVQAPNSNQQQRAVKSRRYDKLPETSSGFVYWPNDKLQLDAANYPVILDLLRYWNEVNQSSEWMNWKLYIPVRECLLDQGFTPEQLKEAFRRKQSDPFWSGKTMSLYRLCTNSHIIHELLAKPKTHDRYARGMAPRPTGEVEIFEF